MQTERADRVPGVTESVPAFRWPAPATFFNRQWWWTTLLVLVALAVLVRLGIWQLDRREQRRAFNAQIIQQLAQPPLVLNEEPDLLEAAPAAWADLKNRQATVRGEYDLARQVALIYQNWMEAPGFHLVTPLVLDGAPGPEGGRPRAVLVDRGWLPAAQQDVESWSQYDLTGPVEVTGYIKLSQTLGNSQTDELLREWYRIDIPGIQKQMPYELLPVYVQQMPDSSTRNTDLPYRSQLDADLSEGNHLSYAIQWFIFAVILGVGYIYFVGKKADEKGTG